MRCSETPSSMKASFLKCHECIWGDSSAANLREGYFILRGFSLFCCDLSLRPVRSSHQGQLWSVASVDITPEPFPRQAMRAEVLNPPTGVCESQSSPQRHFLEQMGLPGSCRAEVCAPNTCDLHSSFRYEVYHVHTGIAPSCPPCLPWKTLLSHNTPHRITTWLDHLIRHPNSGRTGVEKKFF